MKDILKFENLRLMKGVMCNGRQILTIRFVVLENGLIDRYLLHPFSDLDVKVKRGKVFN